MTEEEQKAAAAAAAAALAAAAVVPPVVPAVVPPPVETEHSVEGLLKQNKALLTELANKKTALTTTGDELAAMKAKESAAEVDRLKASGDNKALFELEQTKNAAMKERMILAELKAYAGVAGLTDPDAAALIPRDAIKLDESTMTVTGIEAAVTAFKAAKPTWFALPAVVAPVVLNAATGAAVIPPPAGAAPVGVGHLKPGSPEAHAALAAFSAKYQK